ncbi:hypothetical protein [Paenibacillus sp. RRE4]|uniref:hypothetical protein n=1 Tax=Paenibacillus sp. RRE4 TaxID=2962587 RepID=UPI0037CB5D5B
MSTHYYFSWFNDFFPEKLVERLHEDITDRKSLVMISAEPSDYEGIILPMNPMLDAIMVRLLKATCFRYLKRCMFMRQNRKVPFV